MEQSALWEMNTFPQDGTFQGVGWGSGCGSRPGRVAYGGSWERGLIQRAFRRGWGLSGRLRPEEGCRNRSEVEILREKQELVWTDCAVCALSARGACLHPSAAVRLSHFCFRFDGSLRPPLPPQLFVFHFLFGEFLQFFKSNAKC